MPRRTRLAEAVAGVLGAAERQRDLGADGGGVHVGDAGVDGVHGAEGGVEVAGVDRGAEPELDGVHDGDGLVEVVDLDHRQHRAEHLFAGDGVRRLHAGEDRGGDEGAALAAGHVLPELTAGGDGGPFGHRGLDHGHDPRAPTRR